MTNTLKRILAAVALTAALATAAPADATPQPAVSTGWSYTDCGQSRGFGARVCLDLTTGYGVPVFFIYTTSTTLWGTFCACIIPGGGWSGKATVWTPAESNLVLGGTNMTGPGVPSFGINSNGNPGTDQFLLVTPEVANYVTWFLAYNHYEFIIAL